MLNPNAEHRLSNAENDPGRQEDLQSLPAISALVQGNQLTPAMIDAAESTMLALPQASCPVRHSFGPGLYFREIAMPAGTYAIGHHQRFEHMNIFLKGRVQMVLEDGTTRELCAPMMFVGQPGRKIGYVLEDVAWINVYATNETDINTLEAMFIDKSAIWQATDEQRHSASIASHEADRSDFAVAITELGISAAAIRAQSESTLDQIDLPHGNYKTKVDRSPIEGRGLFACADIAIGEVIESARINGKRTPAGRYVNHAKTPNARMVIANERGDIDLVAISFINGCCGGNNGDEITVDYRQAKLANLASQNKEHACQ